MYCNIEISTSFIRFSQKRIKSDYLKEVILSVELNLLAIKPYSYE